MCYRLCSSQWRAVYAHTVRPPHKTALEHLVKFISAKEKEKNNPHLHCYAENIFDVCSHKEEYLPESASGRSPLLLIYVINKPSHFNAPPPAPKKTPTLHKNVLKLSKKPQLPQNSILKRWKIVVNNWNWRKTKLCVEASTRSLFDALKYLSFKMTHKT